MFINNNVFHPQGGQGWNQPRPFYQGGNGNANFNPNQPTLRDLVYGQAKINDPIQKKLTANDKYVETIQAKLDGFSTTINDKTISRTSTNTINIEHSYKVKAIFNSKSY